MFLPLDGPSLQGRTTITSTTPVRVRVGVAELAERKVVTIQPLSGKIYVYFGDGVNTPNALTVANGFVQSKNSIHSYEASNQQEIYILALQGTVDVVFAERA